METFNTYIREAQMVRHSLFPQEDKVRHYKALLARMRTELDKRQFDEAVPAYNRIVTLMRTH